MEIEKKHLNPPLSIPGEKSFEGEPKPGKFGMTFEEGGRKPEASGSFIALDIESLSLLATASASPSAVDAGEEDGNIGARASFKKTLTKKGSQRGGERTALESAAVAVTAAASKIGRERTSVLIDVANDEDSSDLFPVKTPTAADGASSRCRRISGRRPSPWLHPRRVLVLFASLSSMGTLILLYFTLSMASAR